MTNIQSISRPADIFNKTLYDISCSFEIKEPLNQELTESQSLVVAAIIQGAELFERKKDDMYWEKESPAYFAKITKSPYHEIVSHIYHFMIRYTVRNPNISYIPAKDLYLYLKFGDFQHEEISPEALKDFFDYFKKEFRKSEVAKSN